MMKYLFAPLIFFCVGCASVHTRSQDRQLSELLKSYNKEAVSGVRFDGVYSFYDTSVNYCGTRIADQSEYASPIFFFANGLFIGYNGSTSDSKFLVQDVQNSVLTKRHHILDVAAFEVRNDTIKATGSFVMSTSGNTIRHFIAHFRGILKSPDTIVNWRMVPPYPKISWRLNDLDYLKKPRMLVFKSLAGKTQIDSNAIWINKFKIPKE